METRTQVPTQEQSAIVERVARIVSRVRGTNPDYAHLAAELEPAIPFDVFGIVLLRHDREAVRVIVCKRGAGGWVAHYHQHPLKDSMVERILQRQGAQDSVGTTRTAQPGETDSPGTSIQGGIEVQRYPNGLDGSPAQSGDALSGNPYLYATMIAPLVVEDRVLGALELGSTRLDAYTDETLLRLISAVARVLAAAIESAQVGGNVEIQDRQREELKNVSSALTSDMDLSMILNRIVIGIANALQVTSVIVTLDQRHGRLSLMAQYGLNSEVLQKIVEREAALGEQAIIGFTLRRHQPVISNDIAQDERFPASHPFASELAIRSIFSYPLVSGSTIYGALLLCSPEPGGFTPLKIDILSLFGSQATIAIHNGMLLEAARERRRFQKAIEQLERALQQERSASTDQPDDVALLKQVQEESEHTFGVSFSGLLHFISDHLLTRSERDLQDILHTVNSQQQGQEAGYLTGNAPLLLEERTEVLAQTAEAALARAGLLGDVSAALTASIDPDRTLSDGASAISQLYERVTRDMTSPWFVTDPHGRCIYANPAAEVFCGMRLGLNDLSNLSDLLNSLVSFSRTVIHQPALTLPEVLAGLLPRMRNAEEVLSYLTEFTGSDLSEHSKDLVERKQPALSMDALPVSTLRCVIASEPVLRHPPKGFHEDGAAAANREPLSFKAFREKTPGNRFSAYRAMQLNSAPSDRHYQFMRYALYNPRGQLLANALQVQDVTEQVRDEKNKSVLLSTVSHDLRTPLTTIKAAVTGLLQPDVDWDEQLRREILEDIDAGADHMYKLVNSLIEMSRIDMGALILEKEWCDLVEIVHNALARAERLLAGHPVRTQFHPHLPQVQVDYVQLEHVLFHLLENAVRHSPENAEIVIAVDSLAGDALPEDGHRFLRVQIIDHGSGVPEEERERIFKTFYSLDPQGIGLGLAICRGIIEAHRGRIWLEPAPDGGSCFMFTLPISS